MKSRVSKFKHPITDIEFFDAVNRAKYEDIMFLIGGMNMRVRKAFHEYLIEDNLFKHWNFNRELNKRIRHKLVYDRKGVSKKRTTKLKMKYQGAISLNETIHEFINRVNAGRSEV